MKKRKQPKRKKGWVFVKEGTKKEIGFAEPDDYISAEVAVDKFGRSYPEHFEVYFRDADGVLHPVGPEDEADDFLTETEIAELESHSLDGRSATQPDINS